MPVLILSDGRAGNENQALGVAAALGHTAPAVARLGALPHDPRQWLPVPWLYGRALPVLPPAELVIAAGWQMSRVAAWLRRQGRGGAKPFTVQLQRGVGCPADYDLVALPWHDAYRPAVRRWIGAASNVVTTTAAPNRITPAVLAEAAAQWEPCIRHLPGPRLLVTIGGDSRHRTLPAEQVRLLLQALLAWGRRSRGSLLVTTSRRSGRALADLVASLLRGQYLVGYQLWRPDDPGCGPNPYLGYLAHADAVVATDDSVTMISEAMTAGRPVYLWGAARGRPAKHQAFFNRMQGEGRLSAWDGALSLLPPSAALADAATVAAAITAAGSLQDRQ